MKQLKIYLKSATIILLAACGAKQQQQGPPPPPSVTVQQVASTSAKYYDEYPGTVVALNQTEIRPQVTGYVTGIYFKDGQKVTKGQRLYSIDQQLYNANYEQSLANVEVQRTNMLKAQKDADRYHELDKADAIAKQQVDYADAALETAKKQLAAAIASANAQKTTLGFSSITAPFSGTIGISQVRMGTSVVAGQTILNTLSTDNPMAVDFSIDQKEIYRFTQLQNAPKGKNDSTFSVAFGTDVYPYHGSIVVIDRAVDPQTSTIKARLSFPNENNILRAGMNARVRVLTNLPKVVYIPYKAVTEQLGEFFVYVLGDSSKVTQKKIQLGKQVGTNVIVLDGLTEGQTIVTQGVQNLREGAKVAPAPEKTDSAATKK